MAEENPNTCEHLFRFSRRELLTSVAGVATANLVPNAMPSEVSSLDAEESLSTASQAPTFSAQIFLEITRRNQLRQESKLPLLNISKEWRRLKTVEDTRRNSEEFRMFEMRHRQAVWKGVLQPRREALGDPNWRPKCWSEGVGYQREVYRILRQRFEAERQRA